MIVLCTDPDWGLPEMADDPDVPVILVCHGLCSTIKVPNPLHAVLLSQAGLPALEEHRTALLKVLEEADKPCGRVFKTNRGWPSLPKPLQDKLVKFLASPAAAPQDPDVLALLEDRHAVLRLAVRFALEIAQVELAAPAPDCPRVPELLRPALEALRMLNLEDIAPGLREALTQPLARQEWLVLVDQALRRLGPGPGGGNE